jgi:hypothetical protein
MEATLRPKKEATNHGASETAKVAAEDVHLILRMLKECVSERITLSSDIAPKERRPIVSPHTGYDVGHPIISRTYVSREIRYSGFVNDSGEVVGLGERLWREEFRYSKAGVMITELLPESISQPALWTELDRDKRERAWKAMDRGSGVVRIEQRPRLDGLQHLRFAAPLRVRVTSPSRAWGGMTGRTWQTIQSKSIRTAVSWNSA